MPVPAPGFQCQLPLARSGQLASVAMEFHGGVECTGVAVVMHLPLSGGVGAVLEFLGRGGRDADVGEIGFLSAIAPDADCAAEIFALETVDHESGFVRAVEVELGGAARNLDAQLCPGLHCQVRVRLVDPGPFPAQAIPVEVRFGDVLKRMIAHRLVGGLRVSRPEIEQLVVRCIGPHTEGNADKARESAARRHCWLDGDLSFDGSVLEVGAGQQDEAVAVLFVDGDAHAFAAHEIGGLNFGLRSG
jgi:hypothetical protein